MNGIVAVDVWFDSNQTKNGFPIRNKPKHLLQIAPCPAVCCSGSMYSHAYTLIEIAPSKITHHVAYVVEFTPKFCCLIEWRVQIETNQMKNTNHTQIRAQHIKRSRVCDLSSSSHIASQELFIRMRASKKKRNKEHKPIHVEQLRRLYESEKNRMSLV